MILVRQAVYPKEPLVLSSDQVMDPLVDRAQGKSSMCLEQIQQPVATFPTYNTNPEGSQSILHPQLMSYK